MIASINDFTCYWNLCELVNYSKIIGILFGKTTLIYNNIQYDIDNLISNNSRICDCQVTYLYIYVLFENGLVYEFNKSNILLHKQIHSNAKQIFKVLNDNLGVLYHDGFLTCCGKTCEGITCIEKQYIHEYGTTILQLKNNILDYFVATYIFGNKKTIKYNDTHNLIDVYGIPCYCYIFLYNNKQATLFDTNIKTKIVTFKNVESISITGDKKFNVIFSDNNICEFQLINNKLEQQSSCKSKSIPDSSYCINFNINSMSLFPKYFLDRFVVLVMSIRYTTNLHKIKLPKYLYFMIANCLK